MARLASRRRNLCIRGPGNIAIACVPKVAHTSIKHAVLASLNYPFDRYHPALRLCHADEAAAQNYKIFAFVRDPFDRLVSIWANLVFEGRPGVLRRTRAKSGMSFAAFVMECITPQVLKMDIHVAEQSSFIPDQAIILRYETIKNGWAEIQKVWPGLVRLERFNASTRGDIQEYETPELMQKCHDLYAIDYQRFGYNSEV
ncbi:MAG: sulfotransferase family 2 domain-containing protein [Desulfobacterales bacterium]